MKINTTLNDVIPDYNKLLTTNASKGNKKLFFQVLSTCRSALFCREGQGHFKHSEIPPLFKLLRLTLNLRCFYILFYWQLLWYNQYNYGLKGKTGPKTINQTKRQQIYKQLNCRKQDSEKMKLGQDFAMKPLIIKYCVCLCKDTAVV